MNNTSSTGGFLVAPVPPSKAEIEDILHEFIAGVTGLDGALIRPRWEPKPLPTPPHDVSWCAFGIAQREPEATQLVHGDDSAAQVISSQLTVMATFYGPEADSHAERLWHGLHVGQNHDFLIRHSLARVSVGIMMSVPELVHDQWLERCDIPFVLRHETRSELPIENIRAVPMTGVIGASGKPTTGGFFLNR